MARLFTTPNPVVDNNCDLEIEINESGNSPAPSSGNENINQLSHQNTTAAMTTAATNSSNGNIIKRKKPNSPAWSNFLALPLQELISELKAVHNYLSPIDQDHVDRTELMDLAEQLAAPGLIKHKERAIRVLTACCIANILRLFAPDAPYSIEQFEMIFSLFLHQLKGVAEPDGPYYNYHYFLLESLSTVKSVVLIFDLPQADLLQREIIQMALDMMMQPSLMKNVKLYLLELVQTLLEECDQISVELVADLFIPHLMVGSSSSTNELSRSFVQDLIRQCTEKLQAPLAIHFSDQLSRIARAQESDAVLVRLGREAHEYALVVAKLSLHAATCILSLLEEELKVESQEIRLQSIQTLAQIFNHHQNKLSSLQSLWSGWLGRRNDKVARCRIAWIRGALEIFNSATRGNNQTVCEQILPLVLERLQDPDEKVRLATLHSISSELLPISRSIKCTLENLIEAITDRCLDRKEEVQSAALSLSSDWLFTLLHNNNNNNPCTDLLIRKLLQLPFSESRIHSIAFLGYLERDVLLRMAREFPEISVRADKFVLLLSRNVLQDERSHSAYRALLRHKSQFLKAWTGLLKLSRLPDSSLTDIHRAKTVQVSQFLAERIPGVSELEAQRSLLTLPTLKNSHSDAILLQMLVDLAEGRVNDNTTSSGALTLLARIEAHLKASTSLSLSVKKVINAALPFGSQISLNTALIGQLTALQGDDDDASIILQDLLVEFPQMFENRTVELVNAVINGGSCSNFVALAQYLSHSSSSSTTTTTANNNASNKAINDHPDLLVALESCVSRQLHPPLGDQDQDLMNFDPKIVSAAAQISINLTRQTPSELIQDLIFQLVQEDAIQIKTALVGLTGLAKMSHNNPCTLLIPHFEMIFELISQRLFSCIPTMMTASSRKQQQQQQCKSSDGDLMAGWPRMKELTSGPFQIPVLCVRFLAAFVSSLIRQLTRKSSGSHESLIDLDTISSIRSISVGFFLTRLEDLEKASSSSKGNGIFNSRLQYSLLKGLMTCLPDASASDLTSHLQPLFLALQDTEQRLRYKLSTLLSRLIRSRRLSDAFLPLLFFAGAHESSLLIRSTLKALLGEIIRSWPQDSVIIEELLPVLIVYTVRHPDYEDFTSFRHLIRGYYDYFVENVVDANNCGSIYEAVGRLKLYHFVPIDLAGSERLYLASELAQESIKDRTNHHHWPLQSTKFNSDSSSKRSTNANTLSLLVPDILVELDEAAQIQNIHRIFTAEKKTLENNGETTNRRIIRRK